MATQETALRKRQQIARANRMMFVWVAAISAIVGVAVVLSVFLSQKLLFNEKVLGIKNETASTLEKNNEAINPLKDQIRVLNTNEQLKKNMVEGESQPVQVVLDALPSEANSSAFGASLQEKFLRADGVQLDILSVDPVAGVESTDANENIEDASESSDNAQTNDNQITFRFTVSAPQNQQGQRSLEDILKKLERSIRPIDITTASIEVQGKRLELKVEGMTYFEPAKTVELKTKTVKR